MKYLFGPEMIWLIIYTSAFFITKSNLFPPKSLDDFIVNSWYWIPLLTLLMFAFYWTPFAGKNWLLPRIWIVSLVFSHLILEHLMSSHSQQGPGVGTAYMAGMLFSFISLIVGSIFVKIIH